MKKTCALTMAGVALLLFAGTQSFAGSGTLSFADGMAEGVVFAEEVVLDTNTYAYDSKNVNGAESLTEAAFFTEKSEPTVTIEYLGDLSIPSLQNLMTDGICMDTFGESNTPN